MDTYVGADWASNGWVAAELDESDELSVGFYPTIWNLWHDYEDRLPEQILIDIPIGLPEEGCRKCDREAQAELGSRAGSVFLTPLRDAVYEDDIEKAKVLHEIADAGYGVQTQVWAIVPRIREVDTFLRETNVARELVRESHPEICFNALSDDGTVGLKSDGDGLDARRIVVCNEPEIREAKCDEAISTLTEPEYAPGPNADDVLDATVLAIAAKRVADGEHSTLPDDPPTDAEGLPMEIVHPET